MSKVTWDCISFDLRHSMIGSENSNHSLNQSDAKLKSFTAWLPAFSRALVFILSSHWLFKVFSFLLIGSCNYFDYGSMTLNGKALYSVSIVGIEYFVTNYKDFPWPT